MNNLLVALQAAARQLETIRGFSLDSFLAMVGQIIALGPAVGELWDNATPDERQVAVVTVVNEKIDLPWIPEEIEKLIFMGMYELAEFGYASVIGSSDGQPMAATTESHKDETDNK